jgi:hypothetical protein
MQGNDVQGVYLIFAVISGSKQSSLESGHPTAVVGEKSLFSLTSKVKECNGLITETV